MGSLPNNSTSCGHCWCPCGLPTLRLDEVLLLLDAVLGEVVLDQAYGVILGALLLNELLGCRSISATAPDEDVIECICSTAAKTSILMNPLNLFIPKKFTPLIISSVALLWLVWVL